MLSRFDLCSSVCFWVILATRSAFSSDNPTVVADVHTTKSVLAGARNRWMGRLGVAAPSTDAPLSPPGRGHGLTREGGRILWAAY